mgnify:CR=1 FL=1
MKVDRYCGKPRLGSQTLPIHSWFISPNAKVVREVFGADGLVSDTISCIANRNFNRCKGLLRIKIILNINSFIL